MEIFDLSILLIQREPMDEKGVERVILDALEKFQVLVNQSRIIERGFSSLHQNRLGEEPAV